MADWHCDRCDTWVSPGRDACGWCGRRQEDAEDAETETEEGEDECSK